MNQKTKVEKEVQCPLCGYEFNKSNLENTCEGCPLHNKSCGNVKCANCGYDFPIIEKTEGFNFRNLLRKIFKQ